MEDATRVSILGPIEVGTAGRRVPVAGIKQQSLLAMLALAAPHSVSDDHLIDELWGDEQPANPANALQALVSQLRRLLGRDVVDRVGAGYLLRLDADDVDVTRLERLVEAGRAAGARGSRPDAVERFRDAVALVRGPPLGDLADAWFARDAVTRLDELVAAANEGLVDAELAMGRHAEMLPLLVELVSRHPRRERLREQLALALYRAGRQADALQALRDAREHLLEELGLDPGPALQSLERAVLAHDPALAAPIALAPIAHDRLTPAAPLTSFVGRGHELDALEVIIATNRLTTVVGPGGVGKTRLVTELVRRTDGEVWFVELGPLTVAGAVAEAVAAGVGAPERAPADGQPPPSPEQRAVDRLRDRAAVIVIDNCEHVVAAAARCVLTLLAGCPRLRVVATSREPLGVEGERQFVVGPLPADESAQLFVERARAVQPFYTPDDGGNADLVELCRHLDGLPLAIELAAARAKTLPVPEITERLRDRFALLRRAHPTGTGRHDGLKAAIDWSYELLFDDERHALRTFAVFAGGATLDAAEQVCGPDALELTSRLVDRSLLVADTSRRAVRFSMLESLRAYGLERLTERGEQHDARAAHLAWCIELAASANRGIRGRDQLAWIERLDAEHDNLRAALDYAVEHDPVGALHLTGSLILPWWLHARRQETRYWFEAALAAGRDAPPDVRARVLAPAGLLAEPASRAVTGDQFDEDLHRELDVAEARQREALAIFDDRGDELDAADTRVVLVNTLTRRSAMGEPIERAEIVAMVDDATEVFDRRGDDFGSAIVRVTDAILAVSLGELARARALADAALPFAQRCGDRFSLSRVSYVRGMVAAVEDDAPAAYRHIEDSLRLLDELGLHQGVTAQARLLAPLAERCDQPDLAAQWRTFVGHRSDGWTHYDGNIVAAARNREGMAALAAGDIGRAARAHHAALEWFQAAGVHAGVAFTESCLGFLMTASDDAPAAARHHGAALAAALEAGDPASMALALEGSAGTSADPVVTATMLGAADRLWCATANERTHRSQVDAIAARARAELGDDRYTAAFMAGRALDRGRLLELARGISSDGAQLAHLRPGRPDLAEQRDLGATR